MNLLKKIKLKKIKIALLNILYPPICFGCKAPGKYICKKCEIGLLENDLVCPVCNKLSFNGKTHKSCKSKYSIDGLISIWQYKGIIAKIVKVLKNNKNKDLVKEIVEKSLEVIIKDKNRFLPFLNFLNHNNITITFIPKLKKKNKKLNKDILSTLLFFRSYKNINNLCNFNQASLFAQVFASFLDYKIKKLIFKNKKTKPQVGLKRKERLKNLKGVFSPITKDLTKFENVVLIDDVFTTGATIREAAKVLKKAGVKKVWGFTIARTC